MATITKPIALDETLHTTENPSRNIADVLAEELKGIADNILPPNASQIAYDNTGSGLNATNVQDAIDEVISSQADVIADTLSDLTENKTATITDGVADFETIDGSFVKSLVVEIEPSQSGSGTPSPSNIRPISGYTQEDVLVVGKNRLPYPYSFTSQTINGITFTVNSDGSIKAVGTSTGLIDFYMVGQSGSVYGDAHIASGSYIANCGGLPQNHAMFIVEQGGSTKTILSNDNIPITIDSTKNYRIFIRLPNAGEVIDTTYYPMIRLATDADSAYEPYKGKTYTTAFGQTVYGGTLDVLTGELTITKQYFDINSPHTFVNSSSGGGLKWVNFSGSTSTSETAICSVLEYKTSDDAWVSTTPCFSVNSGGNPARVYCAEQNLADFNTAYANLQIVCTLATPTTIYLTPQTVKALAGENHISASTGDVTECKYSMLINGDDLQMLLS